MPVGQAEVPGETPSDSKPRFRVIAGAGEDSSEHPRVGQGRSTSSLGTDAGEACHDLSRAPVIGPTSGPSRPLEHFLHVEVVHSNPDAAAAFACDVLGGEVVEPGTAALIETFAPGMRCVHVHLGNIVFQFISPGEGMDSWRDQLESSGPGVHNITFTVHDSDGLRQALLDRGAKLVKEVTDVDMRPAGLDGELYTMRMIDAREQLGLRLELIEACSGWPPNGTAP